MIPYKYIKRKDGITIFIYRFAEMREFITLGRRDGNVGWFLAKRKDKITTYKGYGTIENPSESVRSVTLIHDEEWDGKFMSDDEILNRKPVTFLDRFPDAKLVLIDFSKTK